MRRLMSLTSAASIMDVPQQCQLDPVADSRGGLESHILNRNHFSVKTGAPGTGGAGLVEGDNALVLMPEEVLAGIFGGQAILPQLGVAGRNDTAIKHGRAPLTPDSHYHRVTGKRGVSRARCDLYYGEAPVFGVVRPRSPIVNRDT